MPLNSHIGNAEISADPNVGLVLGDVNPATTQAGVMTRYRNADDENNADMAVNKGDFDPHNHASGSGGRQIGTGPVIAIATNGIDATAINDGDVTSAKILDGEVTTEKVEDNTVELLQLGLPTTHFKTVTGSGSVDFIFTGAVTTPLFSIDAKHGASNPYLTHHNAGPGGVSATYDFGSLGPVDIYCRAFGVLSIT